MSENNMLIQAREHAAKRLNQKLEELCAGEMSRRKALQISGEQPKVAPEELVEIPLVGNCDVVSEMYPPCSYNTPEFIFAARISERWLALVVVPQSFFFSRPPYKPDPVWVRIRDMDE